MRDWLPHANGTVIHGRYEIEALLGRGGFGATYRARDRGRFGAPCALKELLPTEQEIGRAKGQFEREALALLELRHECVPRLHEFFEEEGRYFLVQDFVEGETLQRVVERRGPLPEPEVRVLLEQLLSVLEYLHGLASPVVHRDIKPENVILSPNGRINLVDFGAVREALGESLHTPKVTAIGTPGYAPLEQIMGRVAPASDLYAVGATGLFLLTAKHPLVWYDGNSETWTLPGRTGASEPLEEFLTRLLADLPARFPNARVARAALASIDSGVATISYADSAALTTVIDPKLPARRVSSAPARQTDTDASDRETLRIAKRRRRNAIAYSAGGFVLIAGALLVTLSSEPDAGAASAREPATPADTSVAIKASAPTESSVANGDAPAVSGPDQRVQQVTGVGATIEVVFPAGWEVVSQPTDRHLALRDAATGTLFLAGIDQMPARDVAARAFAETWVGTTGRRYARITIRAADPPQGQAWPFLLDAVRTGSLVERGTMLVTPFVDQTNTLFRWWASLGHTPASARTVQSIANTLEVVSVGDSGH